MMDVPMLCKADRKRGKRRGTQEMGGASKAGKQWKPFFPFRPFFRRFPIHSHPYTQSETSERKEDELFRTCCARCMMENTNTRGGNEKGRLARRLQISTLRRKRVVLL